MSNDHNIDPEDKNKLIAKHTPTEISKRFADPIAQDYLKDAVLGAMDGCVSSFAIVAGTFGGGFTPLAALALGLSSLIADGFSMAISNYQAAKSLQDKIKFVKLQEAKEIELIPEGEKAEIRQIYKNKGFSGEILEKIVEVITQDKQQWVNTMVQEEHNLPLEAPNPTIAGVITFLGFMLVGIVPIIPFFFLLEASNQVFLLSAACTGLAFIGIGISKAILLELSILKEAFQVFIFGAMASSFAFIVSYLVILYIK